MQVVIQAPAGVTALAGAACWCTYTKLHSVYVHRKEAALKSVRTAERLGRVPNKPRTQHRSVRVDDAEWDDAEQATAEMGTDRAKVINQFLRWYLRRPGARLPERPPARSGGS
jgi:hypothetical protein